MVGQWHIVVTLKLMADSESFHYLNLSSFHSR